MPLKPCRECGQETSTTARACPKCGAAKPTLAAHEVDSGDWWRAAVIIVAVIALLLWMTVAGWFG